MEACLGSQWLARQLAAIAEAVTRPTMRSVEVRTPDLIGLQALHRIGDRLVGQRTAPMNQARAFCIEYGLAMRVGAGCFHADIHGIWRMQRMISPRPCGCGLSRCLMIRPILGDG